MLVVFLAMTAKGFQQKYSKQHCQEKQPMCVCQCVCNAQGVFSPIQKAHGPEAMPSCPGAQKLPESTWSSHMV